jgi:hypothetical protein
VTDPGREILQTDRNGPSIAGVLNNIPQPRSANEAGHGHRDELVSFSCLERFRPLYLNGPEKLVALTIGKIRRRGDTDDRIVFLPDQRRQPVDILVVQIRGRAIPKKHSFRRSRDGFCALRGSCRYIAQGSSQDGQRTGKKTRNGGSGTLGNVIPPALRRFDSPEDRNARCRPSRTHLAVSRTRPSTAATAVQDRRIRCAGQAHLDAERG